MAEGPIAEKIEAARKKEQEKFAELFLRSSESAPLTLTTTISKWSEGSSTGPHIGETKTVIYKLEKPLAKGSLVKLPFRHHAAPKFYEVDGPSHPSYQESYPDAVFLREIREDEYEKGISEKREVFDLDSLPFTTSVVQGLKSLGLIKPNRRLISRLTNA